MTDQQKTQVKELVDSLLSISLEDWRERAKLYCGNNPFEVFQEMSDVIEQSEEYQKFLHREDLCTLIDETIEISKYNADVPSKDISYSFFNSTSFHIDDGGLEWAIAA